MKNKLRVIALVDGFNLYHSMENNSQLRQFKWLDVKKLAKSFILPSREELVDCYYFSAYMKWQPEKVKRHKIYVEFLKEEGVKIVMGQYKKRNRHCKLCGRNFIGHEEKQTDVNIAIKIFELAYRDECDKLLVVSGDSDLVPAVRAAKSHFGEKIVVSVFPPKRSSDSLKKAADGFFKIKKKHLESSQLRERLASKPSIRKVYDSKGNPLTWRSG